MNNRRDFIKKSLILSTGTFLATHSVSNAFSITNSNHGKKACIIGAGFAGLAAAHRLIKKGWDVTILECRKRIGGRVFSHQLNDKHIVELGAEWVGESHTTLIEHCDNFGLKLNNNQFDSHLIYQGEHFKPNNWSFSKSWEAKFKQLLADFKELPEIEKQKLDQYDWWRYLVNNGCVSRDLAIRELLDSTDFGESIRHVSAFSALAEYSESSPKNEMDLKIDCGNSRLADKFAQKIGLKNILLDHTVTQIHQGDKVKISCANGKTFEVDKVICTTPTLALKKIKWTPELPQDKTDAINELQYARINKHVVTFKDRFWKDENFDMVTDEWPHYLYHATKNQPGPQGALIAYTIGDKADIFGNRPYKSCAKDINNTLAPHFGDISSKIIAQTNYYWGDDQHSLGAYALYGVNQWFRIRPILVEPFLHTHFAGEHLRDWQGFMERAIVTGEDAANQII